jgi:hypothetical protein
MRRWGGWVAGLVSLGAVAAGLGDGERVDLAAYVGGGERAAR